MKREYLYVNGETHKKLKDMAERNGWGLNRIVGIIIDFVIKDEAQAETIIKQSFTQEGE